MKRCIISLLCVLSAALAGAGVASLLSRHLRLAYLERKVNRLEQDLLNLRLWLTNGHPSTRRPLP